MKNCGSIIILFLAVVWIVSCIRHQKKSETIECYDRRTGEPIAVDSIIRKYEREHQILCKKETRDGTLLEWPVLGKKDLTDYCRKYLQHTAPTRKTGEVVGRKLDRILHYMKKNTNLTSIVVVVRCQIITTNAKMYYMTRAPEPYCVYALKFTKKGTGSIIHKHCNFEDESMKMSLTWKRKEDVGTKHPALEQPIAKDEHLLEYELEHRELLKNEGKGGRYIYWPYAMAHHNLNSYCFQYITECVPQKINGDMRGTWKTEKLHYQKLNSINDVDVITVKCMVKVMPWRYHITRALEPNCVYALIQPSQEAHYPFSIIYKHCRFENANDQKVSSRDVMVISKIEVKEESLNKLETLQLFPN